VLRLGNESVEFDEEAAAQGQDLELGLPNNFLMDHMVSAGQDSSLAAEAAAAAEKQAGEVPAGKGTSSKPEPQAKQPATPQQLRALKSVLLEVCAGQCWVAARQELGRDAMRLLAQFQHPMPVYQCQASALTRMHCFLCPCSGWSWLRMQSSA
jgi:hypothetical protein